MGVEERHAALAGRGDPRGAMPARLLGMAEARGMMHWEYGAVDGAFSPWEGGWRGRRPRGERQGHSHHSLTEAHGMPLANRTTPANGDARAQVLPTQRLLLPKGAFIDCTLETAIDSTLLTVVGQP